VRSALEGLGHEFRPHTGTRERKETGKRDEPHQPKERVNEWRRPGLAFPPTSCLASSRPSEQQKIRHTTHRRAHAHNHTAHQHHPRTPWRPKGRERETERDSQTQKGTPPTHLSILTPARGLDAGDQPVAAQALAVLLRVGLAAHDDGSLAILVGLLRKIEGGKRERMERERWTDGGERRLPPSLPSRPSSRTFMTLTASSTPRPSTTFMSTETTYSRLLVSSLWRRTRYGEERDRSPDLVGVSEGFRAGRSATPPPTPPGAPAAETPREMRERRRVGMPVGGVCVE